MDATSIRKCRVCGNSDLVKILDLGSQAATGVFPKSPDEQVFRGPLQLIKCVETPGGDTCGLVQLGHSYDSSLLYWNNYGYRSGRNATMVAHLRRTAARIKQRVALTPGDVILDIGSNDGTFLAALMEPGVTAVGVDPTAEKFRKYYLPEINVIPELFSATSFRRHTGDRKVKVVTSIAMFYDLDEPFAFMQEVASLLADDGIWVFEQSYLPTMVEKTSYDTVCHEHQEYYALKQIVWMTARAGLTIVDVELNDINGGSFSVTAAPKASASAVGVEKLLTNEQRSGFGSLAVYQHFRDRVFRHRDQLLQTLQAALQRGEKILGYGASTVDGLRCLIFIPTYNEAENVEALYQQIQTLGLETDYLFLDDNPPDGTSQIIERLAAAPEPGSWEAIGPERVAVEGQLRSLPGPQLVLGRYRPDHDPFLDWVFNGADIDRQKVVWARDMGAAQNEELLCYYKDRRWWLLDADTSPLRLVPYAGEASIKLTGAESDVPGISGENPCP